MFRGPPFSVTVGPLKGNHFDVEILWACRCRPRGGWVRSPLVTDRTPPAPRRSGWSRAAAAVCLVHVLLLVGLAGFYGRELALGEGTSVTNVVLSLGLILVLAALLAALARVWWVGSTRAVVPTVVWNGLLIPVVIALYGADDRLLASGLLVLVALGIGTAVVAATRTRPPPDGEDGPGR